MINGGKARWTIILLIIILQIFISIQFAQQSPEPQSGIYPYWEDLSSDSNEYVGSEIIVSDTISSTNPVTVLKNKTNNTELLLLGADCSVEKGAKIWAFGRLVGSNSVAIDDCIVVTNRELYYTWGVSVLAGIWTLIRLLSDWKVNVVRAKLVSRTSKPIYWLNDRSNDD